MRQKSIRKNGFSLVELMISAAILVAAILPIFMLFYYYLITMETSRNTTIAVSDAASILESMRSTNPFTIASVVNNYSGDVTGKIGYITKLKTEVVTVSYSDPNADPLEVTVRVDWNDELRARPRWLTITTKMTSR